MSFKDRRRKDQPPVEEKEPEVIAVSDNEEAIKVIGEKVKETLDNVHASLNEEKKPVVSNEVVKEEIEPLIKKERKEREDTKQAKKIGLMGDTPEFNDFRAICKKAKWQINDKLIEAVRNWNMVHYNL